MNHLNECPARNPITCRFCQGIGYDASGQRCDCRMPAKVARVGKAHKTEDVDFEPASNWRFHLAMLAKLMLMTIGVMGLMALVVVLL